MDWFIGASKVSCSFHQNICFEPYQVEWHSISEGSQ
jgi:hypothetical protein